jgi:peptidoglycan/xylan/chitin deacetylase (PgdA/CDA1 family)
MRVGLWRLADVFDEAGVKATVALNAQVCDVYPKAMDEMKRRGWEFMGHGTTNSTNLAAFDQKPDQERDEIRNILRTIEQASGKRPRGWLGSGLVETYNTLDILAAEGVNYCGDWNNDDQPVPMKVKSGKMFGIPIATRSTISGCICVGTGPASNISNRSSISSTRSTPKAASSRACWACPCIP